MSLNDWWSQTKWALRSPSEPLRALQTAPLEPRVLLSAVAPAADPGATTPQTATIEDPAALVAELSAAQTAGTGDEQRRELILIDRRLTDAEQLLALLEDTAVEREVRWIEAGDDLEDVTAAVRAASEAGPFDAVHLFSHGDTNGFALGTDRIDANSLDRLAATLGSWADVFTADGDFLLYGCRIAETTSGQSLLNTLSETMRVDVAANRGLSGSSVYGGDWDLEFEVGHVEATSLSADAWQHIMANVEVSNALDNVNGDTSSIAALIGDDGGDGISLREAIAAAGNTVGHDTIVFNIAGGGQQTITLLTALNTLNDVTIDATTQPGYVGSPLITLQADAGYVGAGLTLQDDVTIKGLSIAGMSGAGIEVLGTDNTIQGNWIGIQNTGTVAGNSGVGIGFYVGGEANNVVGGVGAGEQNEIVGNSGGGIYVSAGTDHFFRGNAIYGNGGLGNVIIGTATSSSDWYDADGGQNGLLNQPEIMAVVRDGSDVRVQVFVQSVANKTVTLDLLPAFSANSREAAGILATVDVTTNNQGFVTYEFVLPASALPPSVDAFSAQILSDEGSSFLAKSVALPHVGVGNTATVAVHESTANTPNLRGERRTSSRSIAVANDGRHYVVWVEDDGAGSSVYGRLFNADGSAATVATKLNQSAGTHHDASVVVDASGRFMVAWAEQDNNDGYRRAIDANGVPETGEVISPNAGVAAQSEIELIAGPTGALYLLTTSTVFGNTELYMEQLDRAGNVIGAQQTLTQGSGDSPREATGAMNKDGIILVAWEEDDGIHVRPYDSLTNSGLGSDTVLGNGDDVAIAAMPDGRFFLAISDSTSGTPELWGQFLNSDGTEDGARFLLDDNGGASGLTTPTVSVNQYGQIAIGYQHGNTNEAYYQIIDSTGATIIGQSDATAVSGGNQRATSVAWAPGTDTLWMVYEGRYAPIESDEGVYKRSIAVTTPTFANVDPTAKTGGPYTLEAGSALTLNGGGSFDFDGDTLTYGWDLNNNGTYDNATGSSPSVSWSTLQLLGISAPGAYTIGLQVSDGNGGVATATTTVTITNTSPVADAGGPYSTSTGGSITLDGSGSSDVDGNTLTFKWDLNNDGTYGDVTGETVVANWSTLSTYGLNTPGSYTIGLEVSDGVGGVTTTTTTVTIGNTNIGAITDSDASGNSVAENQIGGTVVGITAVAVDPDAGDTVTYTLTNDAGGRFTINATTGVVRTTGPLDFEANASHNIIVRATSSDSSFVQQNYTVAVTNANDPPVVYGPATVNVGENWSVGSSIGTITSSDQDGDSVTYSIDESVPFAVNATTGDLTISGPLDFETTPSYTFTVRGNDGNGGQSTTSITVVVADENDIPTVSTTPSTLAYNQGDGAVVVDSGIVVSDQDGGSLSGATVTISAGFIPGQDVLSFTTQAGISGGYNSTSGVLTLSGTASIATYQTVLRSVTYENTSGSPTDGARQITFAVNDGMQTGSGSRTVNVGSTPNSNPVANAGGPYITTTNGSITLDASGSSDPDSDPLTYRWDLDNDGNYGEAGEPTGVSPVVSWATLSSFGITGPGSYTIGLQVDDGAGGFATTTATVTVNNTVVGAVSDTNAGANTVVENQSVGTTVGITATAADPDAGHSVSYTLTNNAGGRFTIDTSTGVVRTAAVLDFETNASHSITVQAASSDGSVSTQAFTIAVTNQNEPPVLTGPSSTTVAEDAAIGSTVATFSATDVDASDTLTYSLSGSAAFAINSTTGEITVAQTLDFDTTPTHTLTVQVQDASGATDTQAITVSVTDVDFVTPDVYEVVEGVTYSTTTDEWWDASWSKRQRLVIGNLGLATQTDVPIAIVLDASNFDYGSVKADGSDLRFIDGDQSVLDYEVESWNVGGESVIWVRVPEVRTDGTDFIDVYYGNAGATAQTNAIGVFTNGYEAVYHLGQTGSTLTDSASGFHLTNSGTTSATGVLGGAQNFSGSGQYASIDNVNILRNTSQATISLWVQADSLSDIQLVGLGHDGLLSSNSRMSMDLFGGEVGVYARATSARQNYNDGAPTVGTWHQLVGVVDYAGDTIDLYIDGVHIGTGNVAFDGNSTPDTVSSRLILGAEENFIPLTASFYDGRMDELRIADTARDADWVSLQYSSQTNNLLTFGTATDNGSVAANDHHAGNVQLVSDVSNGTLVLGTDGNFTYTSNVGFTGLDSFSYRYVDGSVISETVTVSLTVRTNPNQLPSLSGPTSTSINEHATAGTAVATFSATDPDAADTLTYSLVGTTPFAINSTTGEITLAGTLDFETTPSYTLTVRVEDGNGGFDTSVLTINVTDQNESPVVTGNATPTISEAADVGTVVATYSATDPDAGDSVTWSILESVPFTINGSGQLLVNGPLNFETTSSYSLTIRATDLSGAIADYAVTIGVSNLNEAPAITGNSSATIAENASVGTVVATYSATDPDAGDSVTWSILESVPFTINGSGQLLVNGSLNFEATSSYSITVRATDLSGATTDYAITVGISNINETPTISGATSPTISEAASVGAVVATYSATDPDTGDSVTWSILESVPFTINGSGQLLVNGPLDFETTSSYSITIRATDLSGATTDRAVTVGISNSNESPTIGGPTAFNVAENQAPGPVHATYTVTDPDVGDSHTFSLTGSSLFAINATTGEVRATAALDREAQANHTFAVHVTDSSGATSSRSVTVTVTNVNEPPTTTGPGTLTVSDGTSAGTIVGSYAATDPDIGDSLTWTVVESVPFAMSGRDLILTGAIDADVVSSYTLTVRATDAGGLTSDRSVVITISDSSAAPTLSGPTVVAVSEAAGTGSVVASYSATDPNPGDAVTFSIVETVPFAINSTTGQLTVAGSLDYESTSSYVFTVRATDSEGLTADRIVRVNVQNINEAPVATNDVLTVAEDTTATINVLANDVDADGDALSVALISGPAHGTVTATGPGRFAYTPDANYFGSDSFVYQVSDGTLTTTATVTIGVTSVNDAPVGADRSFTLPEHTAIGTVVGTVLATDDDGDPLSFQFAPGFDESLFNLNTSTGQITIADSNGLDFETDSVRIVKVRISDGTSSDVAEITINLTDVDEPPAAGDATFNLSENALPGTLVGALTATDPNGLPLSFSIVDQSVRDAFQITPTGQLKVRNAVDFETLPVHSIDVQVTNSDGLTDTATITVQLIDGNDGPTSPGNLRYDVTPGETLVVNVGDGLLANATDPNGDPLQVLLVTPPADGTLTLRPDGSFRFEPGSQVLTTFVAVVSDGDMQSDPFEVKLLSFVAAAPSSGSGSTSRASQSQDSGGSSTTSSAASTTTDGGSVYEDAPTDTNSTSSSSSTTGEQTSSESAQPTVPGDVDASQSTDSEGLGPAPVIATVGNETDSEQQAALGLPYGNGSRLFNEAGAAGSQSGSSGTDADSANRSVRESLSFSSDQLASMRGSTTGTFTNFTPLDIATLRSNGVATPNVIQQSLKEIEDDVATDRMFGSPVGQAVGMAGSSAAVGYVLMAIRNGALVTGLLAQMPAWRIFDPLAVLDVLDDGDGESLESMIENHGTT